MVRACLTLVQELGPSWHPPAVCPSAGWRTEHNAGNRTGGRRRLLKGHNSGGSAPADTRLVLQHKGLLAAVTSWLVEHVSQLLMQDVNLLRQVLPHVDGPLLLCSSCPKRHQALLRLLHLASCLSATSPTLANQRDPERRL